MVCCEDSRDFPDGIKRLNKESHSSDQRRLDAEAIRVFRDVAAEFAFLSSVAKTKSNALRDGASAANATSAMLADAVDISGPDVVALKDGAQQRADAFAAHLVWLSEAPLLPGRGYLLKAGAQTVGAMVTELKYRVDVEALEHLAAAKELHRNEIAFVNVATVEPITFDPYEENRVTGGFILIDRHTNATVGAVTATPVI